ncbi:unnamed protein product [Mytilus coruscus]|uniref:Uncharacterized protein n=1 Tax=Mytilus coruscus TaxID=42192 RepID=A0A6J8EPD6_MYTCO|nr:unnamed protein product [Mytilus coruscus]
MGAFCGCSGRPIEFQPSIRCEAVQDLNFVMEKMECILGKGHYMFDWEEYDTVKTLCFDIISPDTYISIIGRHLTTVLITDGQVLCQHVVSPPNTIVVFGKHVCTSNTGLPAWVSSVISSTIVSLVCSVIGFDWFIYIIVTIIAVSGVFLRGNQNLRRRLETIQVINYLKNLQNNNNLPQRHPEIHQLPQQQIEQPNLMQNNHNLPQRHPEIQQLPNYPTANGTTTQL